MFLSYCAVPYHISVRSTKPPKISVQLQEPEQTRKGRNYRTVRRQPDVREVVRETKPQWKHGFHGQELEYSKHLENKHPQISKKGLFMSHTLFIKIPINSAGPFKISEKNFQFEIQRFDSDLSQRFEPFYRLKM